MIYLATPYADPSEGVVARRVQIINKVTISLLERGQPVFSPITYGCPLKQLGINFKQEDWYRFDLQILAKCSMLMVAKLDGWRQSRGVRLEIAEAQRLGMPIVYLEWSDIERMIEEK